MKVPGGESMTRKEIDAFTEFVKIYGAQGLAWIKIKAGEWQSPIAKFLSDEERKGIAEAWICRWATLSFSRPESRIWSTRPGQPARASGRASQAHSGRQL